jgi:hypothetical protein
MTALRFLIVNSLRAALAGFAFGAAALGQTASTVNVRLLWDDNSTNEDGFKIERALDQGSFSQIATVSANVVEFNDTGLAGGTTYRYRVRAFNAAGDSPYSNTVQHVTPVPNTAPTITGVADQVVPVGGTTAALAFTVGDAESLPGSLLVSAASSNAALVPMSQITLGGSGANRTVTVRPAAGAVGEAVVTLTVSDGVLTRSTSFRVQVVNTAPSLSSIAHQNLVAGTSSGPLAFSVGDAETAAGSLVVTRASSATHILPLASLVLGGSGSNRTITVNAPASVVGTVTVTVTVSDGLLSTSRSFTVTISAPPPPNSAPTISPLASLTMEANTTSAVLAFTVGDAETTAGNLVVTVSSSNTTLLPLSGLRLGGSGANRTLTVTPAMNQSGTAQVTLSVSDGSLSSSTAFSVTVRPPMDPALLLDFRFEESSGSTVHNLTGRTDNGTLTGAVTRVSTGYAGRALRFNGQSGLVNLGMLDLPGSAFTLAGWIRLESAGGNGEARIISKASGTNANQHVWMLATVTSGGIKPQLRLRTATGNTTTLTGTTNLAVGVWTHVAATYDGSHMRLFVNGVQTGAVARTGTILQAPTTPVAVGDQPQGGRAFHGLIDEFRIYTRALSATELKTLMTANP